MTDEKYVGESSHYLYHPEVASVIYEDCPEARIIVSLRNPIERLYSEYLLNRREGKTEKSFEEFAFAGCKFDESGNLAEIGSLSKIPKGFYYQPLCKWLEVFDHGQVKVILYEEFAKDPIRTCRSIFAWLGGDSTFVPAQVRGQPGGIPRTRLLYQIDSFALVKLMKRPLKKLLPRVIRVRLKSFVYWHLTTRPNMDPEIRKRLTAIYCQDIEALEKLLNLDLTLWK